MQIKMDVFCVFHLGLPPTQDSSHHQDYSIPFFVGVTLNLHLPLLLGGG